ncbi:hypothetical protein BDD12DRAFT_2958 [Trichophaea hybrida]|nr:hypothetical protein BDD12DRAFT_2958 [Trichophaea hybrida]
MSWSIHGLRNISFYRMQKVTREPDIRAASVPPPDLRWPDIPLDVYRLIIEESSRETLYNFCLVSRISREFAIPVLYRNVELMLVETSGTAFAQCLRHLIKANAAKYCEDLRIGISKDFYAEEFDEPPEYELPMEATVMCLVELALEKMPKLKSFRWDSMKLPNDNFLNALKDRPLLTRLRLGNGGWVDRREEIFRVGVFSHLTSLRLKEIASPELVLEIRRAIDNCAALRFLHLTFVDNWAELEEEIQLFDVLFAPYPGDQRKGKKPPGHSLKRLTMHGLWGDMQLGDSFSSIMTTSFSNLDCLTLHNVEEPLLEELGSCESIRVRKFRLRSSSWEPVESILSNSKLELLHIELFRVGYHYDRLVPLICKSGEKLKELRLEWDQENIGSNI